MSGLATAANGRASGVTVPFTRLDFADPPLLEELMGVVAQVAAKGAFTLGSHVEAFEEDLAAYCETDYAVGVASGTDALSFALRAVGIGPGDEVIVPANTFIATAEAVSLVGALPRVVDVDPDTHLLTAAIVERSLGPQVRCVIPVHLFGATVDLDPILELTREAGVAVIEDACQAQGARYRGRRVGSLGALGCFSFYPTKNLGAWGDGGAVVTSDRDLAERVRLMRSHGERPRYRHRVIGATGRLDGLQAAILQHKLRRLDAWNQQRRDLGATLRRRLAEALSDDEAVELPAAMGEGEDHVYHLFVVRAAERDAMREHMKGRGVASAVHYPVPVHRTEAYAHLGLPPGSMPVSEGLAQRICSLPLFPGMSDAEVDCVVEAVVSFTQTPAAMAR